jgi:ATP-dependent DNA ligase
MLARPSMALPVGADWLYEPKLDGFREIAGFRDVVSGAN